MTANVSPNDQIEQLLAAFDASSASLHAAIDRKCPVGAKVVVSKRGGKVHGTVVRKSISQKVTVRTYRRRLVLAHFSAVQLDA
jgi:hypothetical protein